MTMYSQKCLSFEQATTILKKRSSKKLANNTYLLREDDDTLGIKLHRTIIVSIHRDGTYTLNTDSFRTVTTKDRLNRFSPASINQVKGEWILNLGSRQMIFQDGIRVDSVGRPVGLQ